MDVYEIGCNVLLDGTISAQVMAIQIDGGNISYKVVWWNERARNVEWVEAWEVQPDSDKSRLTRVSQIL